MKVTLLVTQKGQYFNEQVTLVGEDNQDFPKRFVCERADGSTVNFLIWDVELLAVAPSQAQDGGE